MKDPKQPNKMFAGIRKGSHGAQTLALPGGHLELFETWEQCATREVWEETGLRVHNVRFLHVTNDIMEADHKHYVTIFMGAEVTFGGNDDSESDDNNYNNDGVPKNMEPQKCQGWESFSLAELREIAVASSSAATTTTPAINLFVPLRNLMIESPESVTHFFRP